MLELKTSIVKMYPVTNINTMLDDLLDNEMDYDKLYNEIYYNMNSRDLYKVMDYIISEYRLLEGFRDIQYNIEYIGSGTSTKAYISLAIDWRF